MRMQVPTYLLCVLSLGEAFRCLIGFPDKYPRARPRRSGRRFCCGFAVPPSRHPLHASPTDRPQPSSPPHAAQRHRRDSRRHSRASTAERSTEGPVVIRRADAARGPRGIPRPVQRSGSSRKPSDHERARQLASWYDRCLRTRRHRPLSDDRLARPQHAIENDPRRRFTTSPSATGSSRRCHARSSTGSFPAHRVTCRAA